MHAPPRRPTAAATRLLLHPPVGAMWQERSSTPDGRRKARAIRAIRWSSIARRLAPVMDGSEYIDYCKPGRRPGSATPKSTVLACHARRPASCSARRINGRCSRRADQRGVCVRRDERVRLRRPEAAPSRRTRAASTHADPQVRGSTMAGTTPPVQRPGPGRGIDARRRRRQIAGAAAAGRIRDPLT